MGLHPRPRWGSLQHSPSPPSRLLQCLQSCFHEPPPEKMSGYGPVTANKLNIQSDQELYMQTFGLICHPQLSYTESIRIKSVELTLSKKRLNRTALLVPAAR